MMSNPDKNHYFGILADWYDRLLVDEKNDLEFYIDFVKERKGSAIELACGTGRLLVPLLEAGKDIEGVDISPEMLAKCREKLESRKLSANLYEQDISSFKTGKSYDTIFISGGSFCMLNNYEDAENCLSSVYKHLKPGGLFILDLFNPGPKVESDRPEVESLIRMAEYGNESLLCFANTQYDTVEQLMSGKYKYEHFVDGSFKEGVEDEFQMRWYGKHEFILMLEKAGFKNITAEPISMMSSHKGTLIYKAFKPDTA